MLARSGSDSGSIVPLTFDERVSLITAVILETVSFSIYFIVMTPVFTYDDVVTTDNFSSTQEAGSGDIPKSLLVCMVSYILVNFCKLSFATSRYEGYTQAQCDQINLSIALRCATFASFWVSVAILLRTESCFYRMPAGERFGSSGYKKCYEKGTLDSWLLYLQMAYAVIGSVLLAYNKCTEIRATSTAVPGSDLRAVLLPTFTAARH